MKVETAHRSGPRSCSTTATQDLGGSDSVDVEEGWYIPVIPPFGRWKQEDQRFKSGRVRPSIQVLHPEVSITIHSTWVFPPKRMTSNLLPHSQFPQRYLLPVVASGMLANASNPLSAMIGLLNLH